MTPTTAPILILRHATAGEPGDWPGDDLDRPLDAHGTRVAEQLDAFLADYTISAILTSPARRCIDTVAPLSRQLGLPLHVSDELGPSSDVVPRRLLLEVPDHALVCVHRETIERLFGGTITSEKGGLWLVERRFQQLEPVRYEAPAPSLAPAEAPS